MTSSGETAVRAASEAAFGSCARGDADRLSDRDFLIVDDDPSVLRARERALKAEGVSVAAYSFRKLEQLASKGALFVQHLRSEAVIGNDRDGRLADLLGSFRPKLQYDDEIRANARLASLIETVPSGAKAELWAADVLYVTVRNFGVLWLAGRQRYVFAYDKILEALQDEMVLDAAAVSHLRRLRFLKSLYRSDQVATAGTIHQKVRSALAGLPRHQFPGRTITVPAEQALVAPAPPEGSPPYHQVRDLEKRLLAARSLVSGPFADAELTALGDWVRDPRAYANLSAARAPDLRRKLAAADRTLSVACSR